ncbi:MAG TPA: hypothetical protein VGL40_12035 [Bacillota bacterium]
MRLLISAVREGFRSLGALGVPVTPPRLRVIKAIPDLALLAVLRRAMGTRRSELVMMRHADVARAEMKVLADELMAVVKAAGVDAPALTRLARSIDAAAAARG